MTPSEHRGMTRDEVVDLLTFAASYDRRTVGKADVAAWLLALGDIAFGDACDAVTAHYRDSSEWIMPSHVRKRVRSAREDRIARTPLPEPGTGEPGPYRQAVQDGVRAIADARALPKAIGWGGPAPSEPTTEWHAARAAMGHAKPALTPQEIALQQVEEARRERLADLPAPPANTAGEAGADALGDAG